MARIEWLPEENEFIRAHPEMTCVELAVHLGHHHGSPAAYKQQRVRLRQADRAAAFSATIPRLYAPPSIKPILYEQIRLDGPSALVLSDLHIPFHHADFINQAVDLAVAWGVRDCVINGDFIDVEAFSKWTGDPENVFEEELEQAEEMFTFLTSYFQRVVYSLGNHEARFLGGAAKRQVRTRRFLRMMTDAENVEISSFEWTEITTPLGLWRAVHPKNASVISARVPALIASRRFTDSHVIGAHGHLHGMVRSEDGKRWAIDSGCCCDPDRIDYAIKGVSTRPVMNVGAVVIKEGYPYLLSPQIDWPAMMRLYGADA